MKVLLTIWISAVLIQEVVPSTLVRYPRQASNASSFLHTEYEAKIEQKGKHGNESFGTMSGKQAIEHDNCNDNWNAFANKCAALIKDLVASLANSVSSKPGDATNLQLHIKNTFRHLDNTHNCSCLNRTGKGLSDIDLSHIFENLTLSTTGPAGDNDEVNSHTDDEEPSSVPGVNNYPKKLTYGSNVNPENEDDPNWTSNSRRQTEHEPSSSGIPKSNDITDAPSVAQNSQGRNGAFHPFLTTPLASPERSYSASEATPTIPPFYYTNRHSTPESSSITKSSTPCDSDSSSGNSYQPESDPISEIPTQTEQPLTVTSGKNQKPMKNAKDSAVASQTPISKEIPEDFTPPKPNYDYDEPTLGSAEHMTNSGSKHNDHSSGIIDPHSYESPDYDSSTETPKPFISVPIKISKDNEANMIPVTNIGSNVPESSEPTIDHDSLSSGLSPTLPNENSYTEDPLNHPVSSTPDCEHTTTACDKTSDPETVTILPTLPSESPSADETGGEVLITPRPMTEPQTPTAEDQKLGPENTPEESETNDSAADSGTPLTGSSASVIPTEEGCSSTPQSIYPAAGEAPSETSGFPDQPHVYGTTAMTTEKCGDETEHTTVTYAPIIPSEGHDHHPEENKHEEHTTVTLGTLPPIGEGNNQKGEENEDHTEVSEDPVIEQPTTFQTTSEDPTPSPISIRPPLRIIPAFTPQDSDEGTTSESKHEKHHYHQHHRHQHHDDEEDDEDDCCSCESCTEEEDSDPKKVKENVCKSLEEARKELKAIFDKIKKKLRCCRKMPHTITTNTSPLPQ